MTPEELAAIEAMSGMEPDEAPVEKKKPAEAPEKSTDSEVRSEAESADDAGEQAEEESPESDEMSGEESETEGDPESDEDDAEWTELLKVAKGDPKKALRLAQALYGDAGGEAKATKADTPEKPTVRSLKDDVAQFYADAKDEKPDAEPKALLALLERREAAHKAELETIKAQQAEQLRLSIQADRDVAALKKAYPKTWKQDAPAIKQHYARMASEGVNVEGLPPVTVYRDLLERRRVAAEAKAAKVAAATKVADQKKTQMAGAAGSTVNGRPVGPTERQHISTVEREMRAFVALRGGRRALP